MARRKLSRAAILKNEQKKEATQVDQPQQTLPEQFENESDLTENQEVINRLPDTCHYTFENFLERNSIVQEQAVVYIYKHAPGGGRSGMELCTQVTGEMPDEHNIGLQFGSGKYRVVIQANDADGRSYSTSKTFQLHKRYDILMNQGNSNPAMAAMQSLVPIVSSSPNNNNNGMGNMREMLVMMQSFMQILQPLIGGGRQQEPEYVGKMFAENFKMMNESMRTVYSDTSQFLNEKLRDNNGLGEVVESESEVTGVMGMIGTIIPLVEKFLPAILDNKPGGKLTVETIKALPQFQKMSKDRDMINKLVGHIYKKHGEDAARLACKKFGIRYSSPAKKKVKALDQKKVLNKK
ncbi:hypothetical protein GQ473_00640 [archaeon]|nr:hypothetical protein [archaeon]